MTLSWNWKKILRRTSVNDVLPMLTESLIFMPAANKWKRYFALPLSCRIAGNLWRCSGINRTMCPCRHRTYSQPTTIQRRRVPSCLRWFGHGVQLLRQSWQVLWNSGNGCGSERGWRCQHCVSTPPVNGLTDRAHVAIELTVNRQHYKGDEFHNIYDGLDMELNCCVSSGKYCGILAMVVAANMVDDVNIVSIHRPWMASPIKHFKRQIPPFD